MRLTTVMCTYAGYGQLWSILNFQFCTPKIILGWIDIMLDSW
jgi:hypothetical protein